MKKLIIVGTSVIAVALFTLATLPALANGIDVGINIGVPGYYQAPAYVEQPVYVHERLQYVHREYDGDWREQQVRARHWQNEQRGEHRYREQERHEGRDNHQRRDEGGEHHGSGD